MKTTYLIAGGVALAGIAFFYFYGKGDTPGGGFIQDVGEGAAEAVVDLADGLISGGSKAIGDKIGVPRTDMTKCERAIAEGRTWDASIDCPALDFLGYINPFR